MSEPLATVIIPNYCGVRFLPALAESLRGQTDARFDVIVVDDASTDGSAAWIAANWPEARLIRNERNLGFAATCNVGIRAAATPFVVLLNNDTEVDPDWMSEGLKPFENPEVGAVASLTLLASERDRVDTAGDEYSVVGGAVKRCHLKSRAAAVKLPPDVFSPSGVSAFYRREAVVAAGLLDERFESYYEDVDLGFRLAWMGYRCVFAPRSICYHHLSSSYSPRGWRYHFNSARNAEIVWWANMPDWLRWKFQLPHLLFLMLQFGHKIVQGAGPAYFCGKLAFLARIPQVWQKRRELSRIRRVSARQVEARLVRDWWGLHVGTRGGA